MLASSRLIGGPSSSVNLVNFKTLFYVPIYFRFMHGQSAIDSGVNSLLFMAFFALGSVLNGGLIGKTHIFHLYMLMGGLLAVAGAALFYAMDHDSSKAR